MHAATEYIHAHGQVLAQEHAACDERGQLTDRARDIVRNSGGMRLLQAKSHGGFEAELNDFFHWVRAVGQYNPSAGWVAGVVGVHPWELALFDLQLQDEVYAANPDTWVASPYAPQGRAVPEAGGFRFSGEWQYSTGTDHCEWVILGGMVTDATGEIQNPPEIHHFMLPRGDYEIVEDSWQVLGLSGTGSKSVRVRDAFVPTYRTLGQTELAEGGYGQRRAELAMYQLPWGCVFSGAIASGVFGIAAGAIASYRNYVQSRRSVMGVAGTTDPFQQEALAEAEADLAAGISHLDAMFAQWIEQVRGGNPITQVQRLEFRRNQVRAVQRVLFGVDKLFSRSGSAAVWETRPLARYWRDLRTAGSHVCAVSDVIYGAWANRVLDTGVQTNVVY